MSRSPTEIPITTGSLWYSNSDAHPSFKGQYILIVRRGLPDSQDNDSWYVYATPRQIYVPMYERNIWDHFVRID